MHNPIHRIIKPADLQHVQTGADTLPNGGREAAMANHLKMAKAQAIQALREQGWSLRRIARTLRISRVTVKRYVELRARGAPSGDGESRPNPPTGNSGPLSQCDPFRDFIIAGLERGLSRVRIWQDLQSEFNFTGAYDCVKRYAGRLDAANPLPVRRMECEPGDAGQEQPK